MGDQVNICFCTASRSERELVKPLIRRLEEHPSFNLHVLELPVNFRDAFDTVLRFLHGTTHIVGGWSIGLRSPQKVDLAFCSFDRTEMLGAALAFFKNNIPIAQIQAGDQSLEGTHDDITRHQITLCSTVQFCNGMNSYWRVIYILMPLDRSTKNCYEVGSIQFDDLEIDYSAIPDEPFDLVLYNAPTRKPDLIPRELDEIESMLDKLTLWVEPNEDTGRDLILERMKTLEEEGRVKMIQTLPRTQFFGLLETSVRCIGNSSSFFLEIPYLDKQHIHIGVRNKGRERVFRPGGSVRIIEALERFFDGQMGTA